MKGWEALVTILGLMVITIVTSLVRGPISEATSSRSRVPSS